MATNKNSFVLYCDLIHTVNKLSDQEAGLLFKHILEYVNDNDPQSDRLTEITFEPIKQSLKRDLKKYERICDRNRENGSKGGRPKKTQKTQSVISKPKKPDSDSVSDSESTNVPLWDEFKTYALSKQPLLDVDTLKYKYESWVENDWCITRNDKKQPIKNWKTTLLNTLPYLKKNESTLPPINKQVANIALQVESEMKRLLTKGYTEEQIKKASE